MPDFADWEITIIRDEAGSSKYLLEPRFTGPDGQKLELAKPQSVTLNLDNLGGLAGDLTAYGNALTSSLFSSQAVRDHMIAVFSLARLRRPPVPLRLRLRLSFDDGALNAVRWETLADPLNPGAFLATNENLLLSRYLRIIDQKEQSAPPKDRLKVLLVIANPTGLETLGFAPVNVADELKNVRSSLGDLSLKVLARLDQPDKDWDGLPTLKNLIARLRDGYDILYLVCHGRLVGQQSQILLENEAGGIDLISDVDLAIGEILPGLITQLKNVVHLPRLVVLASCQSAGLGGEWASVDQGALSALGPKLAGTGIPVVIGMQGDIKQKTVFDFTRVFFNELRRDGQIDRAVAVARAGLVNQGSSDWWSPVLFMRLENGHIPVEPGPAAPFMPLAKKDFIERPKLMEMAVNLLTGGAAPGANSVALVGFGGFGKTTLANAICHNAQVRQAFPDGILWATLGKQPRLLNELQKLNAHLGVEGHNFVDAEDAGSELVKQLEGKRCLLVIDDVWNQAHLAPFGTACARLITTRIIEIARSMAAQVQVEEMSQDEAVSMLTMGIKPTPPDSEPFKLLADRLERWPLMLDLTGAALASYLAQYDLDRALDFINRLLDEVGFVAFDVRNSKARNLAVQRTIDASLKLLPADEAARFKQLAIFPQDTNIYLTELDRLWQLPSVLTERACITLANQSLLKLEMDKGALRLHDVMRAYLENNLANPDKAKIHLKLVDSWGDPLHLPTPYAWQWIVYHLAQAATLSPTPAAQLQLVRRLVALAADPAFQTAHTNGLNDPASLHAALKQALHAACAIQPVETLAQIVKAARTLAAYRRQKLSAAVIFQFAEEGNVEAAVRQLGCFSAEGEWQQAVLLLIAWQGFARNPLEAKALFERIRPDLPADGTLQHLSFQVDNLLRGQPRAPRALQNNPSRYDVQNILAGMDGIFSASGLGYDPNYDPLEGQSEELPGARSYESSLKRTTSYSFILVAYAAQNPGDPRDFVKDFLENISANSYVRYRNRYLWPLLDAVLDHPDEKWALDRAIQTASASLAGNKLEFEEGLPVMLLALQARAGNPGAANQLNIHRQRVCQLASQGSGDLRGDAWGSFTRRLAALAQAYHLLGQPLVVRELLDLAMSLPFGRAGLMSPARLSLAETARICGEDGRVASLLQLARQSAHNVKDPAFCAQVTARWNAFNERWWGPVLDKLNLPATVKKLSEQRDAPLFSAWFQNGEYPADRTGRALPAWGVSAASIQELVELFGRSSEEFRRINPGWTAGKPANVPDPEMTALIAARLAAEVLIAPGLDAARQISLLQKLAAVAEYFPTSLDAVLARLMLAAAPLITPDLLAALIAEVGDPAAILEQKLRDDVATMGNIQEIF